MLLFTVVCWLLLLVVAPPMIYVWWLSLRYGPEVFLREDAPPAKWLAKHLG